MESIKRESDMELLSEQELQDLKRWLFKENLRIESERREIKEGKERLKQENLFFEQKMAILKDGFRQLEADRRNFEQEKMRFKVEEEYRRDRIGMDEQAGEEVVHQLFCGVRNSLTLKKRYKDLIKIYHPDNVAGNHDMVVLINREYEQLRVEYECG